MKPPPWASLSKQMLDLSIGAPEVIARRLQLMQPPHLAKPETVLEMQTMVMEKTAAAWESAWSLYAAGWAAALGASTGGGAWTAGAQRRLATQAVRAADQALRPASRRVKANVKRLRKPAR